MGLNKSHFNNLYLILKYWLIWTKKIHISSSWNVICFWFSFYLFFHIFFSPSYGSRLNPGPHKCQSRKVSTSGLHPQPLHRFLFYFCFLIFLWCNLIFENQLQNYFISYQPRLSYPPNQGHVFNIPTPHLNLFLEYAAVLISSIWLSLWVSQQVLGYLHLAQCWARTGTV